MRRGQSAFAVVLRGFDSAVRATAADLKADRRQPIRRLRLDPEEDCRGHPGQRLRLDRNTTVLGDFGREDLERADLGLEPFIGLHPLLDRALRVGHDGTLIELTHPRGVAAVEDAEVLGYRRPLRRLEELRDHEWYGGTRRVCPLRTCRVAAGGRRRLLRRLSA